MILYLRNLKDEIKNQVNVFRVVFYFFFKWFYLFNPHRGLVENFFRL